MNLANFSFILIAVFFIANLVLGIIKGRGVKTVADFALGDKPFGTMALTATLLATLIGAGSVYGNAKQLINVGIVASLGVVFQSISLILIGFLITGQVTRFSDCVSMGDFVGKLYGDVAKCFCGFLSGIFCIVDISFQIQILGLIFNDFFHMGLFTSIVFSALVISIYTSFGGMSSVVATDVFQFVLIGLILVLLVCFSIYKTIGLNVLQNLPSQLLSKNGLSSEYFINRVSLILFFSFIVDFPQFQRVLVARNRISAKKMYIYTAYGRMIVGLCLLFIVFSGVAVLGSKLLVAEQPLHYIIKSFIPSKIIPFIGIGLIAIVFSTADSYLHTAGLSFSKDFLEPIVKRAIRLSEVRIVTFLVGIFSMVIVLWFNGFLSSSYLFSLVYLVHPMLATPVFYGFLGFKSSKKMFWIAAIMGGLGTLIASYIPGLQVFKVVIGSLSSLISYFVVHLYENKGFKFVGEPILPYAEERELKIKIPTKSRLLNKLTDLIMADSAFYTKFGVVFLIITMVSSIFIASHKNPYFAEIFAFLVFAVLLLCLLIPITMYPISVRLMMPIYFYVVVVYCVPFLVTLNLILFSASLVVLILSLTIVHVFLFLFIKDWKHCLFLSLIGSFIAMLVARNIVNNNPGPAIQVPAITKTLLLQTMAAGIPGYFFLSSLERKEKNSERTYDYLNSYIHSTSDNNVENLEQGQQNINDLDVFASQIDSLADEAIGIIEKDGEKFLNTMYKIRDLMTATPKENISYNLNPKFYGVKELISELRNTVKVATLSSVSVEVDLPVEKIRCDKMLLEKTFWKFAKEFCRLIMSGETDSVLTFSATNINYTGVLAERYNFEGLGIAKVPAMCITFSETEQLRRVNSPLQDCFIRQLDEFVNVEFTDYDIRDIVSGIAAHYGVVEMNPEKLVWQCVVPFDYVDIQARIV